MSYRYAQIDENGIVVSDSYLSGEVKADNMIAVAEDFDLTNKKYVDGEWVNYEPEPIQEQISEQEQAILEVAVNAEYLVALADLGL